MSNKGLKWEYVVLVAVLTLAALSLAYYSYDSLWVMRPLQVSLSTDPDVTGVKMTKSNGVLVIELSLGRVDDLATTYNRLYSEVSGRLQPGTFQIAVTDQRDGRLGDAYRQIHYYLEEAALRGNFGAMIDACSAVLSRSGIEDYRITVDDRRIYVQLTLGDRYLYEVLEQRPQQGGTTP